MATRDASITIVRVQKPTVELLQARCSCPIHNHLVLPHTGNHFPHLQFPILTNFTDCNWFICIGRQLLFDPWCKDGRAYDNKSFSTRLPSCAVTLWRHSRHTPLNSEHMLTISLRNLAFTQRNYDQGLSACSPTTYEHTITQLEKTPRAIGYGSMVKTQGNMRTSFCEGV